jgi:UPF0755 protein
VTDGLPPAEDTPEPPSILVPAEDPASGGIVPPVAPERPADDADASIFEAGKSPRRRRRGRAALVALGIVGVLFACVAAGIWFGLVRTVNPRPAGTEVEVIIPLGSDTRTIAEKLADAGVVANPYMFRIQSRMIHADGKLKAGAYVLVTGMEYAAVIDRLQVGPPVESVTLVVPEGLTIDQVAERLQARSGISAVEFKQLAKSGADRFDRTFLKTNSTKSLEGYLFPKTYRIKKGATASDVIDMMLDQFEEETAGLDLTRARAKGVDVHGVVTIASMVERETRLAKERPVVASVVYNRLDKHMYLEIDATIQYLLGNKPRLLYRDLKVKSPYNTYLHKGLPPGPIASPGLASLRAAADPATTGYLFYVLTGKDGSHTFASNQADFLAAKKRAKEEGLR